MGGRAMLRAAAAGAILVTGCAGPGAQRPAPRPPETAAALARPEGDPACHGTVQGFLSTNAVETVTVKVAVDPAGRVELLRVLAPDLTPAAQEELQRAFAECVWSPRVASGAPEVFTKTWVREPVRGGD